MPFGCKLIPLSSTFDLLMATRSPIVENIDSVTGHGEAYHGYWTHNMNNLNDHFGTEDDLKHLVDAVHAADMYIMIDITINSIAWPGPPESIEFDTFDSPFNEPESYHPFCWVNWTNATSILECWMGDEKVALLDVFTEKAAIRDTYSSWIKDLVAKYNPDGLRIDAVKSIERDFFPSFTEAAGVFTMGEIYEPNPALCCGWQPHVPGVLGFSLAWVTADAFNNSGGGVPNLIQLLDQTQTNCDVQLMGNFIENHDLPRYAGITNDEHQRINALAFQFVIDGMPVVYYGQEQAFTGQFDPWNREALWSSGYDTSNVYYKTIATLNDIRRQAIASDTHFTSRKTTVLSYAVDHLILKKHMLLSCLFNDGIWGSNETLTIDNTGFPADTVLTELFSHETFIVDGSGALVVTRRSGAPMIFLALAQDQVMTVQSTSTTCAEKTTATSTTLPSITTRSSATSSTTVGTTSSATTQISVTTSSTVHQRKVVLTTGSSGAESSAPCPTTTSTSSAKSTVVPIALLLCIGFVLTTFL